MKSEAADIRETITVIRVSDLSKSREWYSKLFGKGPDLEPFPGNVEFRVGSSWVQISQGAVKPSSWSFEVEVNDLVREHERLGRNGIGATDISTVPDVITFFDVRDPDGNGMRWFQVLTKDVKVTGNRP